MMYEVISAFDYYHDGVTPTHYGEGLRPLPNDAAEVAVAEKWARKADQKEPAQEKAVAKTPAVRGRKRR
jgi:hypothetical protein